MLQLLFIEDDPSAVESVLNLINREKADMQCKVSGFGDAEEKIASIRPDIVVLDLLVGSASDPEPEGLNIREFVWENHFCPIVVYSARPEFHDEKYERHPFIKSIKKGSGSPQQVLDALQELRPHVEALKGAEDDIRQSFSVAMREVAPYAFNTFTDPAQRNETINRSGRRRLAALMDGLSRDGTRLASWEQYLSPPVCDDVVLGDILMKADGESDDPTSFRVVLTPSCDLVSSVGRKQKVDEVLVARCCSIKDGLDRTSLKGMGAPKLKERLVGTVLSQGYLEAVVPFPCLKGRIPTMAADLRDLEFIPFGDIGISEKAFLRVASVDSPFRELIAWAYLQIACRPGLPDRDFDSWRDEIVASLEVEVGDKKT